MDSGLERIRHAALEHAAASGTLEDLERAAGVAKAVADAQKSLSDTQNGHRQLQLQRISSLSTFLIPVVSLLALFGTIFFQNQQLHETRLQNEDSQWRDMLTSLRASPLGFDSDVTVAPRLRSFFESARYGDQAKDIAIRFMGRLTNEAGFKDLYAIVFQDMTPAVFVRMLDVARSLKATRINIETECTNLSVEYKLSDWGICTLNTSVNELTKKLNAPFPPRAIQLRQALAAVYAELRFVSDKIGPYLKKNFPVVAAGTAAASAAGNHRELDLSGIDLFNTDLSNVDFTNIDVQNVFFSSTNLAGADLLPKHYLGVGFLGANWWDARAIDQNLLDVLIQSQYPYFFGNTTSFALTPPSEEHYRERVAALCQPPRGICEAQNLRFK